MCSVVNSYSDLQRILSALLGSHLISLDDSFNDQIMK